VAGSIYRLSTLKFLIAVIVAADIIAIYRLYVATALGDSRKGQKRLSPTMLQQLFGPTLGATEIVNHHQVA
jgi:hypothetical protein